MGERNFGARWWRESLGIARWASRPAMGTMGLLGALSLAGCATTWGDQRLEETQLTDARDDVTVNVNALALQRNEGWDVGQRGTMLAFPDSTDIDAAGTQNWREAMGELAATMTPRVPALQPFYVPTLFQSLMGPAGQGLRAVMRPIHGAEMDADFARGVALRAQFGLVDWPKDTALIVDAPGPRAVAVAAALADHFAPVFTFGNWPHPLGVVPAHQTIAATLYYLPMFAAAANVRAPDAPPLFVLDANRLAPYRDADHEFDNRYFVKLPTAEQLAALGVRHVLYVSADATQELDDLNRALVDLCQKGLDVKMVALGDFVRAGDEPQLAEGEGDSGDEGDEGEGDEGDEPGLDPAWRWGFAWAHTPWWWPHYWYRGCWWNGGTFWGDYGFYPPPHGRGMIIPKGRGAVVVGPPSGTRKPSMPSHSAWSPTVRNTMFAPVAGKPHSSFGTVEVRALRSDGRIVGMRSGVHWTTALDGGVGGAGGVGVGGVGVGGGGFGSAGHTVFHNGAVVGGGGFHSTVGIGHGGGGFSSAGTTGFGGGGRSGSIGRSGGFGGGG